MSVTAIATVCGLQGARRRPSVESIPQRGRLGIGFDADFVCEDSRTPIVGANGFRTISREGMRFHEQAIARLTKRLEADSLR